MRTVYDAVIALIGLVAIGCGYTIATTIILVIGGLPGALAGGVAILGLMKLKDEVTK